MVCRCGFARLSTTPYAQTLTERILVCTEYTTNVDCYTWYGRDYIGKKSNAKVHHYQWSLFGSWTQHWSFYTHPECQKWTDQKPHAHTRTPSNYPDFGLGPHNYCRNPDGEDAPWCYTTDPHSRWAHCGIPKCGSVWTWG